jgi:hypothetical protein
MSDPDASLMQLPSIASRSRDLLLDIHRPIVYRIPIVPAVPIRRTLPDITGDSSELSGTLLEVEGGVFVFMRGRVMWRNLSAAIVIFAAVVLLTGFMTDELRANWKYAGIASLEKDSPHALAFFDADNIQYLPNGDVTVWVKTIDASEINRRVAGEKELAKKATEKMAKSYYPPYFMLNPDPDPGIDTYIEMIEWEEAANVSDIRPRARILYEINCRERRIQTLSAVTYKSDGTTTFTSDFDKWSDIVPESTGDTLRRIVCK